MILKNLFRRKARTLLTALGIAIGVAAIVGLSALAEGMSSGYDSMLSGSKADLVLSQPNVMDITYSTVDESAGEKLLSMPEVKAASGMLQSFVQAENNPFFFVFGYPLDSFLLKRFQIIDGTGIDTHQGRGTPLILGSAAAEAFKKKVGDTLKIQERPYRIVGIYQTGDAFEEGGAVLSLQDAQLLIGKNHQVSIFYIQLKDPALRERLAARAKRIWRDLEISGTSDFTNKQQMGDMLQSSVWAIVALAILIGGVGMMNAQLTSVMERTREIGVLRSIGWSRLRILMMILGESLGVCVTGGLLGVGLGWLALYAFSDALISFGSGQITVNILAQAFFTVLILGILGGLYPAWRASRLTPIEALRYEGSSGGGKVRRLPFGGMPLQNLWQRTTRTFLTLGVIGLTIGGIMSMEAIVRGLVGSMSQMSSDAEVVVRQANIADTSLSAVDARDGEKIAAMPEVKNASGLIFTAVVLPEQGGFFILEGYEPNGYAIRRFKIISGSPLTNNRQIILGRTMADALKKNAGDTIILSNVRFRIVGIYETGIGWEELGGVITLRDAQTFLGRPRKASIYAVKLHDPSRAKSVVQKINSQLKDVHAALSGDFANELPDIQNTNGIMAGISLLALIVGGVGVLNTMLMSVLERTREIGVLRALGWRRRSVLGLIFRESLIIAVLGGLFGIGIAFGLTAILQVTPGLEGYITPVWDWDIIVRAMTIALLLGVMGSLYPAFRATRLQPVEALRYE